MGAKGHEAQTELKGEDIGHGVHIRYFTWQGHTAGILVAHRHDDGRICEGTVTFDLPETAELKSSRPKWTVESREPLTLSPSILDKECGLHGFIRNGRWEPA